MGELLITLLIKWFIAIDKLLFKDTTEPFDFKQYERLNRPELRDIQDYL